MQNFNNVREQNINGVITKFYTLNDVLHRLNGPAVERSVGESEWYINGQQHLAKYVKEFVSKVTAGYDSCTKGVIRTKCGDLVKCTLNDQLHSEQDEPALELIGKYRKWYKHGVLHREGGPAIAYANGDEYWYTDGELHCINGPAIKTTKVQKYYIAGVLHRDGGPAYIKGNTEKWYENGVLHRTDGPAITTSTYTKWYFNGVSHRENGPAYEGVDGSKEWYLGGVLHRIGGPAVERNGIKEWHENGKYHRIGGPAIEYPCGRIDWYVKGMLHREDGPAIENGKHQEWHMYGKRHRIGGPAIVSPWGGETWYVNGIRHRVGGPAQIYGPDSVQYYLNGRYYSRVKYNRLVVQSKIQDPGVPKAPSAFTIPPKLSTVSPVLAPVFTTPVFVKPEEPQVPKKYKVTIDAGVFLTDTLKVE